MAIYDEDGNPIGSYTPADFSFDSNQSPYGEISPTVDTTPYDPGAGLSNYYLSQDPKFSEGLQTSDFQFDPSSNQFVYTGGGGTGSGMSFTGTNSSSGIAGGMPTAITSKMPAPRANSDGSAMSKIGQTLAGLFGSKVNSGQGLMDLLGMGLTAAQIARMISQGNLLNKDAKPLGWQNGIEHKVATKHDYVPAARAYGEGAKGGTGGGVTYAAQGGIMDLAHGGSAGRYLEGPSDGMADEINTSIDNKHPAKLSHGEFVIPADVVSHLGNGNSKAGAKVLYGMMDRVRKARTGTTKQGKQINPAKFTPGGIAGYAQGGQVASFATGGTTSTIPAAGTGVTENLSNWAGPYVSDMLGKAQALADTPYTPYSGQLTAGTSPLQQQAFAGYGNLSTPTSVGQAAQTAGNVAQSMGSLNYTPTQFGNQFNAPDAYQTGQFDSGFQAPAAYQPGQFGNQFNAPTPYQAGQFSTGLGPLGSVQDYMNPYLQNVTDVQATEARRQSDISRLADAARLTQAGAYGGSRQAIMEAESRRNLGTQIGGIEATGLQNAYANAQQQRLAESAAGVNAQQLGEQSRQFGANQGMTAAQQAAQYGLAGQQANEASRQFGSNQGLAASQFGAQQRLAGQQAGEASRQFGANQGMTAAQQAAQYGLQGLQSTEASKQFGANYGLSALTGQLNAAQTQGSLGQMQNSLGLANLAAQSGAGATQSAIEQAALDAQKAQYNESQAYPYKQLQFQQSMLQGLPVSTQTATPVTSNYSDLMNLISQMTGFAAPKSPATIPETTQ